MLYQLSYCRKSVAKVQTILELEKKCGGFLLFFLLFFIRRSVKGGGSVSPTVVWFSFCGWNANKYPVFFSVFQSFVSPALLCTSICYGWKEVVSLSLHPCHLIALLWQCTMKCVKGWWNNLVSPVSHCLIACCGWNETDGWSLPKKHEEEEGRDYQFCRKWI